MKLRTDRVLLSLSIGGFFAMSASIVLMSIEAMRVLPGLLFWCGLGIGTLLQIVLEIRRRAFFASYKVKRQKMQKPRNGLLSFGSNSVALVADLVMLASIVATLLALLLTKGYGFVCYIFIAITAFSFCLHCIFNGRNYFHVQNKERVRQVLEQKIENTSEKGEGENEKR